VFSWLLVEWRKWSIRADGYTAPFIEGVYHLVARSRADPNASTVPPPGSLTDFNNCRPHQALGMRTPSQVYTPSATSYVGKKRGVGDSLARWTRPVVDVESPSFVALKQLDKEDTNLLIQPALETA
jgi:hypothetical protein